MDEEQLRQIIKEQVEGIISQQMKGLTESLAPLLSQKPVNLSKLEGSISQIADRVNGLETGLPNVVQSSLDKMLQQLALEADDSSSSDPTPANTTPSNPTVSTNSTTPTTIIAAEGQDINSMIARALADLERSSKERQEKLERRVKAAEEAQAAAQAEAQKIAEQERVNKMKTGVVGLLAGRVIPGREQRLLSVLLNEGRIVEDKESGQYRIPAKDRYGDDVLLPLETKINDVLAEHYTEFLPARPGGGTGGAPNSSSVVVPQLVRPDMTGQDMLGVVGDEKQFNQVIQELESQLR